MTTTRRLGALVLAAMLAGCSSNGSATNGNGSGGTGAGGSGSGGSGSGGSGGGGAGGGGSGGSAGDMAMPGSGQLPSGLQLGTYIVLGDSISDRGGTGPFFYESLRDDLKAKFPNLMYVHAAQAGAITDAYSDGSLANAPTLKSQIDGLGSSYPGDILVTITIGGNDLNGHAVQAIGGIDGAIRDEFKAHLASELAALTAPGRLGTGKVYVVDANIYDFTDGMGDFATVKCGPGANVTPSRDQAVFDAWNGVVADDLTAAGATLYDMHGDFAGHGYNNSNAADVWYDASSCIHPNAAGHDAIRRSIYKIVTGESLP